MSETVLSRFIRYAQIDTQSDEDATTSPSTHKQLDLLGLLRDELLELGSSDARMDEHGYVMATIPAHLPAGQNASGRTIGLIAHVDTSPSFTGPTSSLRLSTTRAEISSCRVIPLWSSGLLRTQGWRGTWARRS